MTTKNILQYINAIAVIAIVIILIMLVLGVDVLGIKNEQQTQQRGTEVFIQGREQQGIELTTYLQQGFEGVNNRITDTGDTTQIMVVLFGAVMLALIGWMITLNNKTREIAGKFDIILAGTQARIPPLNKDINAKHYKESSVVETNSPRELTPIGRALLKDSGGKEYFDKNIGQLYKEFENKTTAWEIEDKAGEVIDRESKTDTFNKIKKYRYQKGISMDVILLTMTIELRDRVMNYYNIKE